MSRTVWVGWLAFIVEKWRLPYESVGRSLVPFKSKRLKKKGSRKRVGEGER